MSLIGQYVARETETTVQTRAHFVESEIADRVVTHCGREMRLHTKRGDIVIATEPVYCDRCPQPAASPL